MLANLPCHSSVSNRDRVSCDTSLEPPRRAEENAVYRMSLALSKPEISRFQICLRYTFSAIHFFSRAKLHFVFLEYLRQNTSYARETFGTDRPRDPLPHDVDSDVTLRTVWGQGPPKIFSFFAFISKTRPRAMPSRTSF